MSDDATKLGQKRRIREDSLLTGKERRHISVAEFIQERIHNLEFGTRGRLPSEASLAKEYGVGINTLRRALDLLADQELIVKVHGAGNFVRLPSVGFEPSLPDPVSLERPRLVITDRHGDKYFPVHDEPSSPFEEALLQKILQHWTPEYVLMGLLARILTNDLSALSSFVNIYDSQRQVKLEYGGGPAVPDLLPRLLPEYDADTGRVSDTGIPLLRLMSCTLNRAELTWAVDPDDPVTLTIWRTKTLAHLARSHRDEASSQGVPPE